MTQGVGHWRLGLTGFTCGYMGGGLGGGVERVGRFTGTQVVWECSALSSTCGYIREERVVSNPIPFPLRQSYHMCLHPDCYIYKQYSRMETDCANVWIAPAPLWTRTNYLNDTERLFAGYAVGVYNRTGIVHLLTQHTFPLTIWKKMAREEVDKAQRLEECRINAARTADKQIEEIESCFI